MSEMEPIDELGARAAAALNERAAHRSASAVAPSRAGRRVAPLAAAGVLVVVLIAVVLTVDLFRGPTGQVTVDPPPAPTPPADAPVEDELPSDDESPPGDDGVEERVACEDRPRPVARGDGWEAEVEAATLTEPVRAGGLVLVATIHDTGESADRGCLFAFSADGGDLAWSVEGRVLAGSPPTIADDLVIVPFARALTAFDATTGETVWSADLVPGFDLAVTDDLVLTVASDRGGGHTLHALDLGSGRTRWQTEGEVWEPLHVHAGTASVRTRDDGLRLLDVTDGSVIRDITVEGGREVIGRQGELLFTLRVPNSQGVLDATTGALIWESNVPGAASTGLLVADERLVVAADVGEVYGIGLLTGTYDWRTTIPPPTPLPEQDLGPTPIVVGGTVHIGTSEGIVAVETATGELRWTARIGHVSSPLELRDGVLYAVADEDLVAVDVSRGEEVWRRPVGGDVWRPLAVGEGTVSLVADSSRLITIDAP